MALCQIESEPTTTTVVRHLAAASRQAKGSTRDEQRHHGTTAAALHPIQYARDEKSRPCPSTNTWNGTSTWRGMYDMAVPDLTWCGIVWYGMIYCRYAATRTNRLCLAVQFAVFIYTSWQGHGLLRPDDRVVRKSTVSTVARTRPTTTY